MKVTEENRENQEKSDRSIWAWKDAFKPIPDMFFWYKHHAVPGTLILAAYLVVKCYVIARGNLATALGIVQYAGVTSVVAAGLLSSLPILTALMLGWLVLRMVAGCFPSSTKGSWKALACVLGGTVVLSLFFTPVPFMLIAICLGFLAGLVNRLELKKWATRAGAAVVGLIGLAATLLMLYTVWVPHETVRAAPVAAGIRLTPTERAGTVVGYVLADDPGGWITILTSGDRTIVRYRDADVKSITVCERPPHGGFSDIAYASPFGNFVARAWHISRPKPYFECP